VRSKSTKERAGEMADCGKVEWKKVGFLHPPERSSGGRGSLKGNQRIADGGGGEKKKRNSSRQRGREGSVTVSCQWLKNELKGAGKEDGNPQKKQRGAVRGRTKSCTGVRAGTKRG